MQSIFRISLKVGIQRSLNLVLNRSQNKIIKIRGKRDLNCIINFEKFENLYLYFINCTRYNFQADLIF